MPRALAPPSTFLVLKDPAPDASYSHTRSLLMSFSLDATNSSEKPMHDVGRASNECLCVSLYVHAFVCIVCVYLVRQVRDRYI